MEQGRRLWIPQVEAESVYGIHEVGLRTHLLSAGKIFLSGAIDADMADAFHEQILYLETEHPEKPVMIYINSEGGAVNAGLMIYDLLQAARLDITVTCVGRAASMAAIILAGGRKGKRFILPHAEIMIHEPLLSDGLAAPRPRSGMWRTRSLKRKSS